MGLTRRTFLTGILGSAYAASASHAAGPSWIDVHMHIVGGPQSQFGSALDQAVAKMDSVGIAKAIALPPPLPQSRFDYSDYLPALKRFPGRFRFLGGGGLLNPMLHEFAQPARVTPDIKQRFIGIANQIADAGAAGFGEIALLHFSLTQNHPFEQAMPEHPLMVALVEIAGRRNLVIDLHMDCIVASGDAPIPPGLLSPPNPPKVMGNIAGFERLLAHDRNARIVWAHGGSDFTGNLTPALIRRLMDAHANLYMSLRPVPPRAASAGPFNVKFQNTILTDVGIDEQWLDVLKTYPDRFVLGSDSFFFPAAMPPGAPAAMFSRGNEARLSASNQLLARLPADLARRVAQENAARLYKI
jgi:hypothetical protein